MKSICLIDEIKKKVYERNYRLTFHARVRMFERHISNRDLVDLIINGEIIEEYPDKEPCPAVLMLGFVSGRSVTQLWPAAWTTCGSSQYIGLMKRDGLITA